MDGPTTAILSEPAFEEQEDASRAYETNRYEVMTCYIDLSRNILPAWTFRLVGNQTIELRNEHATPLDGFGRPIKMLPLEQTTQR